MGSVFVFFSFFGEDPPLLALFLKKLGYEVMRNNAE